MERASASALSGRQKVFLLTCNCIPLLHWLVIALLATTRSSLTTGLLTGVVLLYLLPPIAARLILTLHPIKTGRLAYGSTDFFAWWLLLSLQGVFARLPFLEECLRLIPGLYSLWLRLWGSRVGTLTYWAPGTTILDRSFLQIGDDVVFGAGVRLNPHVLTQEAGGKHRTPSCADHGRGSRRDRRLFTADKRLHCSTR